MRIDKIFIISLKATDPELQKSVAERLEACQFLKETPFEIIQAFDGRNGDIPEGWNAYDGWQLKGDSPHSWNEWWTRPVLPGEIGCAVSHRLIWERIALNGWDNCLILEDDFVCNESLSLLEDLPEEYNWDVAILGRDIIEGDIEEEEVARHWVKPRHFYNMHAYVLHSSMDANKLLSGGLKENCIPSDEYLSALGYPHRRDDIREMFPPLMNIIATKNPQYVTQNRASIPGESDIESTYRGHNTLPQNNEQIEYMEPPIENNIQQDNSQYFEILDDSNWDAWKEKYLNLSMAKHEFELMVSDRGDNVFEFPLFTPKFCREAIALAESKDEWTIDRHEHYPTNDVLLQEIGLNDIYNRVLDEVVRPLAIHLWNLEGSQWDAFSNENFMARYTTTRQSHLSLHHDRSHLTMVIKLNDEFSGGGTWFPQYQKLSNPEMVGTAVLHPGMITHRHGARPITSGARYITVSFIRTHEEP